MYNLKRNIIRAIRSAAIGTAALVGLTGCSSLINDDLAPCPEGVVLRFVYDYNMEFANAFPSQVDCLTLPVAMNADCIDADPGKDLHPLFFGDLDLTVDPDATDYTAGTVYMMKDTNSIRILLQNVDGTPVDPADFTFEITDNNTLLSWQNAVVPTAGGITYHPWATGQAGAGETEEGDDAILAFAEFSTSRLIAGSNARLVINSVADGHPVLSIPLVNYLLLLKSLHFDSMGSQEFLDRESRWNMILFLDNGRWIDTRIVINDWIVRLNNADL